MSKIQRGHKVEKNPMRKERTYDVLPIQKENDNGTKKYSEKATSPNKQKEKTNKQTRVAIGAPAYRRTIGRRAAAAKKA